MWFHKKLKSSRNWVTRFSSRKDSFQEPSIFARLGYGYRRLRPRSYDINWTIFDVFFSWATLLAIMILYKAAMTSSLWLRKKRKVGARKHKSGIHWLRHAVHSGNGTILGNLYNHGNGNIVISSEQTHLSFRLKSLLELMQLLNKYTNTHAICYVCMGLGGCRMS